MSARAASLGLVALGVVAGCRALGLGADEGRQVKVTTPAGTVETRGPWVPAGPSAVTSVYAPRERVGDYYHVEVYGCPSGWPVPSAARSAR